MFTKFIINLDMSINVINTIIFAQIYNNRSYLKILYGFKKKIWVKIYISILWQMIQIGDNI